MMTSDILNVASSAAYDEDNIVRYEYHTHAPYASSTLNTNDEIRIPINQQDVYCLPSQSYLYIECQLTGENDQADNKISLVNNGLAFLFDEIRYELCGTEIERVKNMGIKTIWS